MLDWIRGALGGGITSVKDLASSTYNAIKAVWATLTGLGHVVGVKWSDMVNGAKALRLGVQSFANAVYTRLRHVYLVLVPRIMAQLRREATSALSAALALLRKEVKAAYNTLVTYAEKLAAQTIGFLLPKIQSALARIADIYNTALRTAETVEKYLAHPEALAAFIFAPLWHLAIRQVQHHAEPIARYLLRHAVTMALAGANTIEDVLARIL